MKLIDALVTKTINLIKLVISEVGRKAKSWIEKCQNLELEQHVHMVGDTKLLSYII